MISNTFNFLLTLKNRPIRWRTLYNEAIENLTSEHVPFSYPRRCISCSSNVLIPATLKLPDSPAPCSVAYFITFRSYEGYNELWSCTFYNFYGIFDFGLITYKFTRLVCTVHYFIRTVSLKLMTLGRHVFDYGFGELFLLRLMRARRETDYSLPTNTELRIEGTTRPFLHTSSWNTKRRNYENLSALDTSALRAALWLLELMLGY
jgi:hypothetical protein